MDCVTSPCPGHTTGAAGQMFTMLLQSIMAAPCNLSNPNMWPEDWAEKMSEDSPVFDFIVVGAGAAGSAVAHRLAENPKWKILLIEAGGDPPVTSEIPSLFFNVQKTDLDWGYYTEPSERNCLGFKDGRCYWPGGKVLGGTTAMNAMLYIRGNKGDYDTWEDQGNPGWGYDTVTRYFKKSEDMRSITVLSQDFGDFHGVGGLKIDDFYYRYIPLRDGILKAGAELGYNQYDDINAENKIGFATLQGFIDHGTRCSSAKAFLNEKQSNLKVIKYAQVTKIIINQPNKRAIGIRFLRKGKMYTVWNSKEVILSAGATNSPQILMLSGIGPKDHLSELQIPVIEDLPVGQNLQDHVFIPTWVSVNAKQEPPPNAQIKSIFDYFINHDGDMSGVGLTNVAAFINTVNSSALYPNTQYHFVLCDKNDTMGLPTIINAFGYVDETRNALIKSNVNSSSLMIMPSVLNPKSRGEIKLQSNKYYDPPKIYPNYFDDDADVDTALSAFDFITKFVQSDAMQQFETEFINLDLPNCRNYTPFEKDYWKCFVHNMGTTEYHHSCSVKMGPAGDPTTVVDSRLRVHNVRSLRVADASIMPKIISGNINAPTIMIGEKAADMIKEDWRYFG